MNLSYYFKQTDPSMMNIVGCTGLVVGPARSAERQRKVSEDETVLVCHCLDYSFSSSFYCLPRLVCTRCHLRLHGWRNFLRSTPCMVRSYEPQPEIIVFELAAFKGFQATLLASR